MSSNEEQELADRVQRQRNSLAASCEALSSQALTAKASELRGKVILVTGAASGIGAAFSLLAASHGAHLILADISEKGLQKTASTIKEAGHTHTNAATIAPIVNVTKWEQQRDVFEFAEKQLGKIDIVVSCAGVTERQPGFLVDKYDSQGKLLPPDMSTLDINLTGSVLTAKLAINHFMKHKTKGSLVLLGSLAGFFGLPMGPFYCTAKHGIIGLTRALHYTSWPEGINVTAIAPWFTDTPIVEKPVRLLLAGLPLAQMEDVTKALLFACTQRERAAGAALSVDPKGVLMLSHDTSQQGQGGFNEVFGNRAIVAISRIRVIRQVIAIIAGALGTTTLSFGGAVAAYFLYKRYR